VSTITYPDGSQLVSTALNDAQIQQAFQIITAQMLGIITTPFPVTIALVTGQSTFVVDSIVNLYPGELITVTGLPVGTTILSVDTLNSKITVNNTATNSGPIIASVSDPNFPFKVRIGWQVEGQPGPPLDQDTVTIRCSPLDTDYGRMRDIVYSDNIDNDTQTATDVFTRAWRTNWTFYGPNSVDNARAVRSALITIQFTADYLATFNLYINPSIKEPQRVPENFQGRWWERVDLEVEMNEQVTETFTVGIVKSVEIKGYTKDGQFTDFTVTNP
jgi:hypothetical protein